jgi:hypothetical protein
MMRQAVYGVTVFVALCLTACGSGTIRSIDGNGPPIGGPNQPPTLANATFTVVQGRPLTAQLNGSDPENQVLTYTRVTDAGNGGLVLQASGAFSYTSNAAFTGIDTFQVRVTDPPGATSAAATITINVTANGAPIANDDVLTVPSGATLTLNVTANDTDPNNDPLTVASIQGTPFGGTAVPDGANIRFTPSSSTFRGFIRLQYQAADTSGRTSNTATAIAFVGSTQPFQLAYVSDDFTAGKRELALADLLRAPQRINGPTAAGTTITDFAAAANGRTFTYIVDSRDAFVTPLANIGTGAAIYPVTLPTQSLHDRTAISADGTRVCSSYFDLANSIWRSYFLEAANAAGRTEITNAAIGNFRRCFQFLGTSTDFLLAGQNDVLGTNPGLFRSTAANPTTLALLTRPNAYDPVGWQTDQIFVAPDGARVLFTQRRLSNRGIYDLPVATPQTEQLISAEFSSIFGPTASADRTRVAFAIAAPTNNLVAFDRAAPGVVNTLFVGSATVVPMQPVIFSEDAARVAYAVTDVATPALSSLYESPFADPASRVAILPNYAFNSSTARYDDTGNNVLLTGAQAPSVDFRLLQVARNPVGAPVVLSPANLFTASSALFAQSRDSAVVAVSLRTSSTGPSQLYLINRSDPGLALLVSSPQSTVIGAIRFVPR